MEREEALNLLKKNLKNENLIKHCLAVEAIMKEVAGELGEEEEKYALTGLLHDVDYEKTRAEEERHGILAEEILRGKVEEEVINAIKEHNFEKNGVELRSKLGKILIASDAISGLIIAAALIRGKKLENVSVESLENSFKKKDFARNCSRERIRMIEEFFPLTKFFEIALRGVKKISNGLGL